MVSREVLGRLREVVSTLNEEQQAHESQEGARKGSIRWGDLPSDQLTDETEEEDQSGEQDRTYCQCNCTSKCMAHVCLSLRMAVLAVEEDKACSPHVHACPPQAIAVAGGCASSFGIGGIQRAWDGETPW